MDRIGHILRKPLETITRQAITWNPSGKRRRGRPRNTWQRDTEKETKEMDYTRGEIERMATDRKQWRSLVDGLCSEQTGISKHTNFQMYNSVLPSVGVYLFLCLFLKQFSFCNITRMYYITQVFTLLISRRRNYDYYDPSTRFVVQMFHDTVCPPPPLTPPDALSLSRFCSRLLLRSSIVFFLQMRVAAALFLCCQWPVTRTFNENTVFTRTQCTATSIVAAVYWFVLVIRPPYVSAGVASASTSFVSCASFCKRHILSPRVQTVASVRPNHQQLQS